MERSNDSDEDNTALLDKSECAATDNAKEDNDDSNNKEQLPLFLVAKYDKYEHMKELLEGRNGDGSEIKEITNVDKPTDESNGRTALLWAVLNGNEAMVRMLLSPPPLRDGSPRQPADPSVCDTNSFFPLWVASQDGHIEIVRLLLQHGADVNQRVDDDEMGRTTPLFMAVIGNHVDVVELLLEKGADPNIPETKNQIMPLDMASMMQFKGISKRLAAKGAMSIPLCIACPPREA